MQEMLNALKNAISINLHYGRSMVSLATEMTNPHKGVFEDIIIDGILENILMDVVQTEQIIL